LRRPWQAMLGISIGAVFQAVPTYALISWTPTYLQRVHAWSAGQAGGFPSDLRAVPLSPCERFRERPECGMIAVC
jgi:hypothetical protein